MYDTHPSPIRWWQLLKWLGRKVHTRCAWCKGCSTFRDPVNISVRSWPYWVSPNPTRFGEQFLLHKKCVMVAAASRLCLCVDPMPDAYGECRVCRKRRKTWDKQPTEAEWYLAMVPKGARVSAGVLAEAERLLKEHQT